MPSSSSNLFISNSPAMKKVKEKILKMVANTKFSNKPPIILLLGETGTGKNVVAKYIHNEIHNETEGSKKPFVVVNIKSLSENLVESELFGHEKDAFTGATKQKKGHFETANEGTLFLDEIGELPHSAQIKLLNVLNEDKFKRVGGTEEINFNAHLITATNKDLRTAEQQGSIRSDFYYRINKFPITLPPLRKRKEEIPGLVTNYLRKILKDPDIPLLKEIVSNTKSLSELDYNFPGNVRELENLVDQAFFGKSKNEDFLPKFKKIIQETKTSNMICRQESISALISKEMQQKLAVLLREGLTEEKYQGGLNAHMQDMLASALDNALHEMISSGNGTNLLPNDYSPWGKLLGHKGLATGKPNLGKSDTNRYIRDGLANLYNRYSEVNSTMLSNALGTIFYGIVKKYALESRNQSNATCPVSIE